MNCPSSREAVPKRCILLLLDGLGDRSHRCLGGRTPLQAAHTPNLDRVATLGANGLFHADRYGMALPSENAHFAIFGYELNLFPGRGYLEALGADVAVAPGEIALLAHFVSVAMRDNALILIKDRPETSEEETAAFAEALHSWAVDDITLTYTPTKRLDGVLRLTGPASPFVSDSDCFVEGEPLLEIFPAAGAPDPALAARTARVLKRYLLWCHATLCRHPLNRERQRRGEPPVNGLATQRPGWHREISPFAERWGLRAATISSGLVYWGLGRHLGMAVHKTKDSDDPGQDLLARLQWAMRHGDDFDFIHVHSKAPDVAAHSKNPFNKVKAIESLDRGLGRILDPLLAEDTVLVVTADHSTPSGGPMVHSGEPVPIAVHGPGVRRDANRAFDEVSCAGGALGQLRHGDFMYFVLNWLDRAKLQGLLDSPVDYPYWPGKRRPFTLE